MSRSSRRNVVDNRIDGSDIEVIVVADSTGEVVKSFVGNVAAVNADAGHLLEIISRCGGNATAFKRIDL